MNKKANIFCRKYFRKKDSKRTNGGTRRAVTAGLAALFFFLTFQCGCGIFSGVVADDTETDEYTYTEENGRLVVVGFSQIGSESVWRTANTASVQRALTKENGYFLIYRNARQKQENQIKTLRSFISQRVDYIVFSPVTESGWDTVLEEAKAAGIPVILMDRKADVKDDSLYTAWVGTDTRAEGEKAARWLEQHLKEQERQYEDINIVVLEGTIGSSSQIGRSGGFESIAGRYGNWHILEKQSGDFTTAKGKEIMQDFLKRYPDIDVVVSQNDDMTFGALEAIEEAGRSAGTDGDIIVISFDAVRGALEMVADGRINVDIECNPEQGEYVERVIRLLEQGRQVEKSYVVEEQVFTRDNVSQYLDGRTY